MRRPYHHGDLRAALIQTAVELIGERGVRGFSLAETSRRLGVAASAPYAHFADRDALLAAVAVHAYERLFAEVETERRRAPAERLAAIAAAYVRFAGMQRPLFELLHEGGVDKARFPEVAAAERPLDEAFRDCVGELSGGEELAVSVEATAHGHAMLLLDGRFGEGEEAVGLASARAAEATLALVRGLTSARGDAP
jgi:AcrR family transcriptional regulator